MSRVEAVDATRRGEKYLDMYCEYDWRGKLYKKVLKTRNKLTCPLGLIYGHYDTGRDTLCLTAEEAENLGFTKPESANYTWEDLDEAWKLVLKYPLGEEEEGDETTTTWYIVMDGPYSVALMTTNEVEAGAFAAGLKHGGTENTLVEKKVYNA